MRQNPFTNALAQLARATNSTAFDENFLQRLQAPEREIKITIPVVMDDGSTRLFEGHRVQYSNARGPYKGGIRYHEHTEIDEVRALAFWMTLKTAIADLPMGGGKGGVTVNPKTLSKRELEQLSRGWVRMLYHDLGPQRDVPAPDVNTTPEIMSWMVDEYERLTGDTSGAAFTGKPLDSGGSAGRGSATGMGGFYVFDALREPCSLPRKARVVIQGTGNVGLHGAKIFSAHEHTVMAISDSTVGVVNEKGLDIEVIERFKKANGTLRGFPGAREVTNQELLELSCDVLIPAALEHQITKENAARIQAKMVLELANGPTTPEADDILFARNIPVVPDILANAGGVIVSTFEWEQNLKKERWSEAEVFERLNAILSKESQHILNHAKKFGVDLRRSAFIIALERLQRAYRANSKKTHPGMRLVS